MCQTERGAQYSKAFSTVDSHYVCNGVLSGVQRMAIMSITGCCQDSHYVCNGVLSGVQRMAIMSITGCYQEYNGPLSCTVECYHV